MESWVIENQAHSSYLSLRAGAGDSFWRQQAFQGIQRSSHPDLQCLSSQV